MAELEVQIKENKTKRDHLVNQLSLVQSNRKTEKNKFATEIEIKLNSLDDGKIGQGDFDQAVQRAQEEFLAYLRKTRKEEKALQIELDEIQNKIQHDKDALKGTSE